MCASQAILLLRRVFALGAQPSSGDIEFLVESLTGDTGQLALELLDVLHAHPITLNEEIESKLGKRAGAL